MNAALEQYGLAGVVIIGLSWFVLYLMKEHKVEREEWKRTNDRQLEDSNKNIRENTNVLSGLKTLLESRK